MREVIFLNFTTIQVRPAQDFLFEFLNMSSANVTRVTWCNSTAGLNVNGLLLQYLQRSARPSQKVFLLRLTVAHRTKTQNESQTIKQLSVEIVLILRHEYTETRVNLLGFR